MIKVADIRPDAELKKCLEGKISIQTSEWNITSIPVYQQGERPDTGLADEFIDINVNGTVRAMLHPLGLYRGNLAVSVYCKTQNNGVVKQSRVTSIISQMEEYLEYKRYGRYFFKLNADNIITPTTINVTSGYSVTVLNVEWRMNETEAVCFGLESGGNMSLENGGILLLEE